MGLLLYDKYSILIVTLHKFEPFCDGDHIEIIAVIGLTEKRNNS